MGLDRLGAKPKSGAADDAGDSVSSMETEKLDALQAILRELQMMNNFFALMTDEDNPPIRDSSNDTNNLSE